MHKQLLELVAEFRFITTKQLVTLTRTHYGSAPSAHRQTNRHLTTLKTQGLVEHLERKVGGWAGGSNPTIWTITNKGASRLKQQNPGIKLPDRVRTNLVSTTFVEHTLAVTETSIRLLTTMQNTKGVTGELTTEPTCHRNYLDINGVKQTLKPDLHASIQHPDFTEYFFLEIDRSTENPARIVRKCHQYNQYRKTGAEQDKHGVFPIVVWVVPNEKRAAQLKKYITEERVLPEAMFLVTTISEVGNLVTE